MIYVSSYEDSKKFENYLFTELEITPLKLMAKAAQGLFNNLNLEKNNFLILSNFGNNGGDGLCLAKLINDYDKTKKIKIYICATETEFMTKKTKEVEYWYDIVKTLENVAISFIDNDIDPFLLWAEYIVDCIFGIGYVGKMPLAIANIITKVNETHKYVLSCDIPSGIENDNALIPTIAIKADKTVTFFTYKMGFLSYNVIPNLGEVIIWQLDFHPQTVNDICANIIQNNIFFSNDIILSKRELISHKGVYGNLLIFASSSEYLNAGTLVANMALNAGVGLVIWAMPPEVLGKTTNIAAEVTFCDSTDRAQILELLDNKINVVAYGMGKGKTERTYNTLNFILENYKGPIIIDADGINVLDNELLRKLKGRAVLTPHPLELSRIIGKSVEEILQNRITIAKEFANKYKIILVLKGYQSIITDGNIVYINSTGNPYMAAAGMGDTLTGIIASLVGQKYQLFDATIKGTYLHGLTGDLIAEYKKPVLPTDIIKKIGYVLANIINKVN